MEKKKQTIYAIIALVTLALLVVGATYAYFQNQYGESSQTDVKVTTYTTDLLTFETGDAINITADQETFAQGKGNRTGSSFAKAILQANSKTNVATANYYIYLNIESNEFTYTTIGKPELVLQVTDNSGNPVTSIDGLTYVTVQDGSGTSISGFDVTEKSGLINLINNKEISASPRIEEQYNITLVLVNYDFDQNNNAGKSFNAKLMIQKDKVIETIALVCSNGQSLSDCIKSMNGKDDTLYYHDASLENGAGDNSYRYAGANPNNYVCFGSDDTTCPTENLYRIIGVIDGKVKLIHAYGATTTMLGTNEGYANTYQEVGFKLLFYKGKEDFAKIGTYKWNKTRDNTWSTSTTNTTNLNTNYLTYLDSKNTKWKNMIADTTWYVGGMTAANGVVSNAKTVYNYEIGAYKDATTTVTSKIGLMYISEYYYGATPDYWMLPGFDKYGHQNEDQTAWIGEDYTKAFNDNWMSTGLVEWTISRGSDDSDYAFVVLVDGALGTVVVDNSTGYVLRPSFSLSSSIKFTSGEGTAVNPIRLKL